MFKVEVVLLNAYIRKEEKSDVNNLSFHLTKLVKKSKINPSLQNEESNQNGSRNKIN